MVEQLAIIFSVARFLYYILVLLVVLVLYSSISAYRQRQKMPPGPPGVPLLGNSLQIPSRMAFLRFTEWSRQYGAIYSLNLAGQPVVVLNTHKVVTDLLDRRSKIYSDRPRSILAGEILTGGVQLVLARYGELWRRLRRAAHSELNLRAVEKYQPQQFKEAAMNVLDMIANPDDWNDQLEHTIASNVLTSVYGWPRLSAAVENQARLNGIRAHSVHLSAATAPGTTHLVDILPFIKHLPTWLAEWKRLGIEWHDRETDMFQKLNDIVAEQKISGESRQCMVHGLLENEGRYGVSKKENAWLSGIMFAAGVETTLSALSSFVLAMVLHPDVMRKAQAELDAIVGRQRLPTFNDQANLPYLCAIIKETLRWRSPAPAGVPRRVTEDDWYEGYLIPKGTIVIANVWAMNRDPEIFPDFEEFRPERFLDETGTIEIVPSNTRGMGHVTYGFGRRLCVGYNFANQVLFIQMAMLLWAFNFEKQIDANGDPITPSRMDVMDFGVTIAPAPFKCNVRSRYPDLASVIQRELEMSE